MQNTPDTINLEQFVDNLLEEKAMVDLDAEVIAQIRKDLLDRVEDHINAAMLEALSPDKLEDFEKILSEGSEADIQTYCSENIPDLDQLIATTLLRFRSIYLG